MDEPQEEGALVLVNDRYVIRRTADGHWSPLVGDGRLTWDALCEQSPSLVQLHQGEAGAPLRKERAIRVDKVHPRRQEALGTYITHWADPRLIDQAPNVWEGWTIVERWVTEWEDEK